MCGRYAQSRNPDQLVEIFEIDENEIEDGATESTESTGSTESTEPADAPAPGSQPSYNVAPTTGQPVILTRAGRPDPNAADDEPEPQPVRRLKAMHWGLIPSWAKDRSIGNRMINARSEGVFETNAYRKAILSRRCLIPADGWYEWQKSPTEKDAKGKPRKQPFFTTLADPSSGGELAFGGLYELWRDRSVHDDDPAVWVFSFTILTMAAEPGLDVIHDRMPVVVDREHWDDWLSPGLTDPDGIRALLAPHEPGRFSMMPVSTRVNSVRNNGPELLEPADLSQLHGVVDPATGELIGSGSEPLF